MTRTALLFSPNGRIGRQTYWLSGLVVFVILAIVAAAAAGVIAASTKTDGNGHVTSFPTAAIVAVAVASIVYLVAMWTSMMLGVKRCHDRDRTGWILLLYALPIANSWLLVELLFISGTRAPNQYGADPITHWIPPPLSAPPLSAPPHPTTIAQSPLAGPV